MSSISPVRATVRLARATSPSVLAARPFSSTTPASAEHQAPTPQDLQAAREDLKKKQRALVDTREDLESAIQHQALRGKIDPDTLEELEQTKAKHTSLTEQEKALNSAEVKAAMNLQRQQEEQFQRWSEAQKAAAMIGRSKKKSDE